MSEPTQPPVAIDIDELVLRRFEPADAPNLSHAIEQSLSHLEPWMPWARDEPMALHLRIDLIEEFRARWERASDFSYGLFVDGTVVGGCGLHRRIGPHGLEIGYWVHVDHLGRGYATRAAAALTGAAFEMAAVRYAEIRHDKANVASRRIPERLGYSLIAEEPDAVAAPGEIGISCVWRMTRPDPDAAGSDH